MSRRHSYFSLEEANGILPTLEYFFSELMLNYKSLENLRKELEAAGAKIAGEGVCLPPFAPEPIEQKREEYYKKCKDYDELLEEILSHGVEVIDPQSGVVNFYSWWDNEEVVFSWQYGEPTVQFWMDPGESYTSRRPIRQLFFDAPVGRPSRH